MKGVVYAITCTPNGAVYVGSTMRSFKQRWSEHRWYLRKGRHHSSRMQRCFKKYGEEAFAFSVVEHVSDLNFLLAREQFHIWRQDPEALMNSAPVSDSALAARLSNLGRVEPEDAKAKRLIAVRAGMAKVDHRAKFTDEVRARMSVSRRKRVMKPVTDETRLRISQAKKGCKTSRLAVERSVATRTAFIESEVDSWIRMRSEGKSFREIERITGRCRKVVARECARYLERSHGLA